MTAMQTRLQDLSSVIFCLLVLHAGAAAAVCQTSNCADCLGTTCWSCNTGYYLNNNSCSTCRADCTACIGWNSCIACTDGRWGDYCQHNCTSGCSSCTPSGICTECITSYYMNDITCQHCQSPCTQCISATECFECMPGYYGPSCQSHCNTCNKDCDHSGACTQGCTYGHHGTHCEYTCSDSCEICTQDTPCQCALGKYKEYYGNWCNQCPDGCSECTDSSSNHVYCSSCKPGYYHTTNNCVKCPGTCATCTSSVLCQACDTNSYNSNAYSVCDCNFNKCSNLSSGMCTACSDQTWYAEQTGCCPCNRNCKYHLCDSNGDCQGCNKGYYGDTCQISCNSTILRCVECSGRDSTYLVCTECLQRYFSAASSCQVCNAGCKYNGEYARCDVRDGTCLLGCVNGRFGKKCDVSCSIENCDLCTDTSGSITCDRCLSNYYKESEWNCSSCSPHCYLASVCSRTNGSCSDGCDNGWHGERCVTECPPGCAVCNQGDGVCKECKPGKHGITCDKDCNDGCKPDNTVVTCVQANGACMHGCINGYWQHTCDDVCSDGCLKMTCNIANGQCIDGCRREYFGASCESRCSDNCLREDGATNTNICQRLDGVCSSECKSGYYSDTCGEECGYCQNTTCHRNNGTCVHGCVTGHTGASCIQAAVVGEDDGGDGATIVGAVGASVVAIGLVVVVVVVVVVVILIKRKRRQRQPESHAKRIVDGKALQMEDAPVYYSSSDNDAPVIDQASLPCDSSLNSTIVYHENDVTTPPSIERQEQSPRPVPPPKPQQRISNTQETLSKPQHKRQSNTDVAATCKQQTRPNVKPKENRKRQQQSIRSSTDSILEYLEEGEGPDSLPNFSAEGEMYYNTEALLKSRIPVDDLADFVAKKTESEFQTEFKKLPAGLIRPCSESQKPHNFPKNRYNSIYPYDDTRVLLTDGGPDYINASYIQGHNNQKAYIAALGPTDKTIHDFWRMAWQEEAEVIVMLTRLVENNHTKCHQYWPDRGVTATYGDIVVVSRSEDTYAEYTIRSFSASKREQARRLHHIHYTAWPDKGVPDDVTGLIEFRQKVTYLQSRCDVPVIVHCSAGIGRTGTFIALDTLTWSGEDERCVDIFGCVVAMRGQRVNMVQTVEQYEYLHHAVVHSLTFDCRSISSEELPQHYTELISPRADGTTLLDVRFAQLQSAGEAMSKESETSVKTNRGFSGQNRTGSDIPGDRYRPKLFLNRKQSSSNYINAVRINGFKTSNIFIAAQTPLPTTVVDFLTLIVQEKCACVVAMDGEDYTQSLEKYWPPENSSCKHGIFTVTCPEVTTTTYSTQRKLVISTQGKTGEEDDHIVWQTQYTDWPPTDVIPRDAEPLLRMIKDVETRQSESGSSGPVIVHCMTGAVRCGLYCAVAVMVEKMEIDHAVSLVNTLRQIRSRRRTAIPNKDQYQFCHQAIVSYLESFSLYSNFSLRI